MRSSFVRAVAQTQALSVLLASPTVTRKAGKQSMSRDGVPRSRLELDKSIPTALDKHPQLKEYIVCLPFDLPDARVGKGLTPLAHWQNWRDAWIASAKEEGRVLSIELWGANEIGQRLTANDPAYAGRLLYWFEQEALTHSWFRQQFEKSRAALGSRYMPESNVELPIRRDFLAFVRDPSILAEVEQWRRSLQERGHNAVAAIKRARGTDPEPHSDAIEATVGQLIGKLGAAPIGPDQPFPLASWEAAAIAAESAVRLALCWSNDLHSQIHAWHVTCRMGPA